MANFNKLIRSTQEVMRVAELVSSLAGKAALNDNLRDSLKDLTGKAKTWRPITSPSIRLDRKLTDIIDYADDFREQFPHSSRPNEWTRRARHIRSRVRLVRNLNGKQRRSAMVRLKIESDDLLRDILNCTAELLEQEPQESKDTPRT